MKKTTRKVACAIAAAGLSLAMALGGVAPTIASAIFYNHDPQVGDPTYGSLVINKGEDNSSSVTYDLYEVFTVADAEKLNSEGDLVGEANSGVTTSSSHDDSYVVSGIAWKDDATKTVVTAAIHEWAQANDADSDWAKDGYTSLGAQDAADYLTAKITSTTNQQITGTGGTNTRVNVADATQSLAQAIAAKLANATGVTAQVTGITPGEKVTIYSQGYYLAVTTAATTQPDGSTLRQDTTGTSPIWMVLGALVKALPDEAYEDVVIDEKTSVPTLSKQVLNDGTANKEDDDEISLAEAVASGDWTSYADSQRGQEIWYKLEGTVADNIATYDSYLYTFSDTLAKGLDLVQAADAFAASDVTVYVVTTAADSTTTTYAVPASLTYTPAGGSETTHANWNGTYAAQGEGHALTVDFANLKALKGYVVTDGTVGATVTDVAVNATTHVYVYYQAKLNANAVIAGAGNENTATLTYSNNPEYTGKGTTEEKEAKDYTYALRLYKVDLGTEEPLAGVYFTIQATGPDDTASTNLYVKADGTLGTPTDASGTALTLTGADADTIASKIDDELATDSSSTAWKTTFGDYLFATDANGVISVTGLDAGTYTISEVYAPEGYVLQSDTEVTITPTYDADATDGNYLTKVSASLTEQPYLILGQIDKTTTGDNALQAQANTGVTTDGDVTYVNVSLGDTKEVGVPLTGSTGIALTFVAGAAVLGLGIWRVRRSRRDDEA